MSDNKNSVMRYKKLTKAKYLSAHARSSVCVRAVSSFLSLPPKRGTIERFYVRKLTPKFA